MSLAEIISKAVSDRLTRLEDSEMRVRFDLIEGVIRDLDATMGQSARITQLKFGTVQLSVSEGLTITHPEGTPAIVLEPWGNAFFGSDVDTPEDTSLAIFSQARVYNSEPVDPGDVLLGDNSDTKANLFWDNSAGQLHLRSGTTVATVLDTDGSLQSFNYDHDVTGWRIDAAGDAEFNNIQARGSIRASVFNIGEITATAGTYGVFKSASSLAEDCSISGMAGNTVLEIKNSDTNPAAAMFAQWDVIRIKAWNGTILSDTWFRVTAAFPGTGSSTYNCQVVSGTTSVTIPKGTAVIDYGPSDSGYLMQSADGTFGASANLSIATFVNGVITAVSWGTGGSGYTAGDLLDVDPNPGGYPGTGGVVEATTVDGGGSVTLFTLINGGRDYHLSGERTLTGGTGSGARVGISTLEGPYNTGQTLRVRLGNMYGSFGTGSNNRYGIGIGDYSGGNYLSYNAERANTFKIVSGDGNAILGNMRGEFGTGSNDRYGFGMGDYAGGDYLSYNAEAVNELKLSAGGGEVLIDADGITLGVSSAEAAQNKIKFLDGANERYYMQCWDSGGSLLTHHWATAAAGDNGLFVIESEVGNALATLSLAAECSLNAASITLNAVYATDSTLCDINADAVDISGDLYTKKWTNYSTSSSITGWTSFTIKSIYYKRIGNVVFCQYVIEGSATGTSASFTLPSTLAKASDESCVNIMRAYNSGSWAAGLQVLGNGSYTVNLYSDPGGGGWASSGTKRVQGQFWYEIA
jgi:hypothetical protein